MVKKSVYRKSLFYVLNYELNLSSCLARRLKRRLGLRRYKLAIKEFIRLGREA
jgi:hypothetical protein